MLDIIKQRLNSSVFVIPAARHRHFFKELLMIIIAINLTFFSATSLADNYGEYGTRANNGDNVSSELKLKNHITSTVSYYIHSSETGTCSTEGSLGSGVLPAAPAGSSTKITVSSDQYENNYNVVFCTTCGDTEYLVYKDIKHEGCDNNVASPERSNLTCDSGIKHMNIYCDAGGKCNDWGTKSGCS